MRDARNSARGHKPDYMLLVLAAALLAIGLTVVYAVSPGMSVMNGISQGYYISKQLIAIALGAFAFFCFIKNTLSDA